MFAASKSFQTSITSITYEQLRHIRIRKSPGMPRSKTKQFWVPKEYQPPQDEIEYLKPKITDYKIKMRSILQLFVMEKHLKNSLLSKSQSNKTAISDDKNKLLKMNNDMNMQIREIQEHDMILERNAKEKEKIELLDKQKAEQELLQEIADNKVKRLKILARTFVDPNNLEFEIEKALNERVTYEFSIDSNGNISKPSQNTLKNQPLINDQ